LWTAVARDTATLRGSTGVSDDDDRARHAAEAYLRAGQARLAYVEVAYTAIGAHTLNPVYMRTGEGWWAQPNAAGEAVWVPFSEHRRQGAPAIAVPAGSTQPGDGDTGGQRCPGTARGGQQ
jgi:hypothetical protein